jgi:soluble lytic murein transglycosylase-like protein
MKTWLPALAAAAALVGTSMASAPALAQTTYDYFTARAVNSGVPAQLDQRDREYYGAIFAAIDRQDWAGADALLNQRADGLLHPVARAELYLAANSPRVELWQIDTWLPRGRALPHAQRLARLAATRGATSLPDLPREQQFYPQAGIPKRVRPAEVQDGTMPVEIRAAILERITNDDPDGARALLDGIDATLSPEARAEWRQRVAWSYYIENMDPQALALARTVGAGAGPWVAEGEWVAGLAAWRLGDCGEAGGSFERSAFSATNPELRSAALYWGSRAALRCRQPARSTELLRAAAGADETLYGMLAAEQLGQALSDRVSAADFSEGDWQAIGGIENVRVAVALMEIGRDREASEVLLHQARIGDASHFGPLSRLARDLGMPQTQLYMAYNAPSGARSDPASQFPAPKWVPMTGWRVDPALAYAHTLQESNFRANAVSPAEAQGLMQITPITVRHHAPRLGLNASQVDIFEPSVNLAFGQRNLEMLRDDPATGGALPKIIAAYNAGLTPVTRWNSEVRDQGDPLLYMESIPYWETRGYVSIVLRNYWMYERQARAASQSRVTLAQNGWPRFPEAGPTTNGRVYLSSSGGQD